MGKGGKGGWEIGKGKMDLFAPFSHSWRNQQCAKNGLQQELWREQVSHLLMLLQYMQWGSMESLLIAPAGQAPVSN